MARARASTPALAFAALLLLLLAAGAAAKGKTKISKREAAQIVAIYEANPKILTVIRELIKDMEHWKRAKEGKGRRGLLQTVTPSYNTSYTDGDGDTYTGAGTNLGATSTSSSYCTGTTANCAGQKCCSCCTTPKGYIDCDPPQTVGTCCTCPPTPSPPPPIPTSCCANIFQSSKTCANPCQSPTICTDAVTVSGYCDGNSGYSSEITCVSTFCT